MTNDEHMMKAYERWRRALGRSDIPERFLDIDSDKFRSFIAPGALSADRITGAIYDFSTWVRGYIFIIDGGTPFDDKTPADVRRSIGCAILQNGVTHACQSPNFCPPYGRYVDYKMFVSHVMNKEMSSDFVEELCDNHFLFISEIYLSTRWNDVMRNIVSFKMDEIIRRRVDAGLVTILSFATPCAESVGKDLFGEEVESLLSAYGKNGTSVIKELKIARIRAM